MRITPLFTRRAAAPRARHRRRRRADEPAHAASGGSDHARGLFASRAPHAPADLTGPQARRRMVRAANAADWRGVVALARAYPRHVLDTRGIGGYDFTPLHAACDAKIPGAVRALLELGARPDARAVHRYTPLYVAARSGCEKCAGALLEFGAQPDLYASGYTALQKAALLGHFGVCEVLLENDADLDVRNGLGDQALHLAAKKGHKNIVQLLLDNGANVRSKGHSGKLASTQAADAKHAELAQYLINIEEGVQVQRKPDREDAVSEAKTEHENATHRSDHKEATHRSNHGEATLRSNHGEATLRSNHGEATLRSNHGEATHRSTHEEATHRSKAYGTAAVASVLAEFVCRGDSASEQRHLQRRIERNAAAHRVNGSALLAGHVGAERLARILLTDSKGKCNDDGWLWSATEFINRARSRGTL